MTARHVVFECHCSSTVPGQWVAVVGSSPPLGCWDVSRAVRLHTTASSFPIWSSSPICLSGGPPSSGGPPGTPGAPAFAAAAAADAAAAAAAAVEFKFIIVGPETSCVHWEPLAANRLLPASAASVCYRARYGEPREELLLLQQQQDTAAAPQHRRQQHEATWMGRSRDDSFSSSLHRLSSGLDLSPQSPGDSTPLPFGSGGGVESCARLLGPAAAAATAAAAAAGAAAGGEGTAAAEGTAEAAGAAAARGCGVGSVLSPSGALGFIIDGDRHSPSWGCKLEIIKNIIKKTGDGSSLSKASTEQMVAAIDALCYAGVYAELISQGFIECKEDGRHFRPNKHANISREVSIHLEILLQSIASRQDDFSSVLRLVLRSIPPSLPSFAAAFRVSQPLTRIRNIAHRDDIPIELKNEIKNKIQNKLHRCAGPEDLNSTRLLLQRVHTQQHAYPASFIYELDLFYKELNIFFNQTDLIQRLKDILSSQTPRTAETIYRFIDAKERSDPQYTTPTKLLLTLSLATNLRFVFSLQLIENAHQHDADEHIIQNM